VKKSCRIYIYKKKLCKKLFIQSFYSAFGAKTDKELIRVILAIISLITCHKIEINFIVKYYIDLAEKTVHIIKKQFWKNQWSLSDFIHELDKIMGW
jgi:hypothetical protein